MPCLLDFVRRMLVVIAQHSKVRFEEGLVYLEMVSELLASR